METVVRFTPLCGVSEEEPLCYLLEIDSFSILLDCGWDEAFDEAALEPIKSVLPRVDAVLLSHPDIAHLGALPYLVGRCGLAAPIYSTKPVRRMGEMFMFEAFLCKQAESEFAAYDLDHVDAAFRLNPRWTELRYSQRHVLVPPRPASAAAVAAGGGVAGGADADGSGGGSWAPGGGIAVTPLPAGRFPGGAVWRIALLGSGEEVVYAVDYNHRKERLLNETSFHDHLAAGQQPALLISDALNALMPPLDRRRRDDELLAAITATVEAEGCVLIPTDAAGRVLELALLLDEHFARARVAATPVILSATIKTVLEFARTQLEYLGSELVQAFSLKRTVPFSFRKLSVVTRVEELGAIPGPKVVLATMPSLEAGPARQLLVEWASQPRNTIIFTERAQAGTLAAALQNHVPGPQPLRVQLRMGRRVPLEGDELAAWQAARAEAETVAALPRRAGGELAPFPSLTNAASLAAADRIAAASRLLSAASLGTPPSAAAAAAVGRAVAAAANATAAALAGAASLEQPLRSSTGSISRLVRDALTGAVKQQLGPHRAATGRAGGDGGGGGGGGAEGPVWESGLLLDGFVPPKDAVHPMFPDEDAALHEAWDEYGAVLGKLEFRVPMFAEGGSSAAAARVAGGGGGPSAMDVDGGGGGGGGAGGGGGEDVADELMEAPTKLVVTEVEMELRAALRFYDCEGRSDGRALREYLARVAPRRVALVHGSDAARAELAGALRTDLAEYGTEVATPGRGEAVEARLAPSHMAALGERLAGVLGVRQAGQYGVAWLEGVFARGGPPDPLTGAPLLQLEPPPAERNASGGADADALAPPPAHTAGSEGTGSVLLAQAGAALTLSKLKAALAAAGFESHFPSRGVLAVMVGSGAGGGTLVVTLWGGGGGATDRAHVVLEGPASEAYFRVREVIYQQFGVC